MMSDGRSIRLPSTKFAQVRERAKKDRLQPVPRKWDAEVQILPSAPEYQRVRIEITACLRNKGLRIRIFPLAPDFPFAAGRDAFAVHFRIANKRREPESESVTDGVGVKSPLRYAIAVSCLRHSTPTALAWSCCENRRLAFTRDMARPAP